MWNQINTLFIRNNSYAEQNYVDATKSGNVNNFHFSTDAENRKYSGCSKEFLNSRFGAINCAHLSHYIIAGLPQCDNNRTKRTNNWNEKNQPNYTVDTFEHSSLLLVGWREWEIILFNRTGHSAFERTKAMVRCVKCECVDLWRWREVSLLWWVAGRSVFFVFLSVNSFQCNCRRLEAY